MSDTKVHHPCFARFYAWISPRMEKAGFGERRGQLLAGLTGRVLEPCGELRFFEHVRADTPGLARVQRVLDATLWPTFGGGCHPHRDTRTAIEDAGFTINQLQQLRLPTGATSPHILGVATTKEG